MILIMKLAIPARYCLPWLCRHREHLTDCTLHGYENSPDTKKNEIFMDKKKHSQRETRKPKNKIDRNLQVIYLCTYRPAIGNMREG